MGLSFGLPDTWDHTTLRREVIRNLNKLQNRYKLIKVNLLHGKDAYITFLNIPGESFEIFSSALLKAQDNKPLRLKFLLLIEALLKKEGKDINAITKVDLSKRFNIHKATIFDAFNDLKNMKE